MAKHINVKTYQMFKLPFEIPSVAEIIQKQIFKLFVFN